MKSDSMEFSLNPINMNSIPFQKYENNFTFIVENKRYSTSRFVADIISPKIRKLHFIDESINEFSVNIDGNINQNSDYFDDFLKLCSFEKTYLDETRRKLFSAYFLALGNINEYFLLQPNYFETLNTGNVIDRLLFFDRQSKIESDTLNIRQKLISFIAAHFEEINKEEMKKLCNETLDEIMKSDKLKINNEDSLLDFIITLYSTDKTALFLFENVLFINVTKSELTKFVHNFSFTDLNFGIWTSLCSRLLEESCEKGIAEVRYLNSQQIEESKNCNVKYIEFRHEKGKDFEGIMNYLTKETGGNIHDNGTIEIKSNSIQGSCHPKYLVDYDKNSNEYYNNNEPNTFICFDFKKRPIQVSSYSIQTCGDSPNGYHMRNWVLEVSKDGKE